MSRRKVDSLLVEGGAQLLRHCLETGLWDEARVETAPVCLGQGVTAPSMQGWPVERVEWKADPGRYVTYYKPGL